MFTIIHGSHRHGYCWDIVCALCAQLNVNYIDVTIIDLSVANIDYCCGS